MIVCDKCKENGKETILRETGVLHVEFTKEACDTLVGGRLWWIFPERSAHWKNQSTFPKSSRVIGVNRAYRQSCESTWRNEQD